MHKFLRGWKQYEAKTMCINFMAASFRPGGVELLG